MGGETRKNSKLKHEASLEEKKCLTVSQLLHKNVIWEKARVEEAMRVELKHVSYVNRYIISI